LKNEEKFIIEEYIECIEISKQGILIQFQQKQDELISWDDKRISVFLPK